MKTKIIDNFLSKEEFEKIKYIFMEDMILPWFYSPFVTNYEETENFIFQHIFYRNYSPTGETYKILDPLITRLQPQSIIRIQANLGTKTTDNIATGYHSDFPIDCTTAIFYMNTNNGYTLFEDGTRVDCVANRLVEFPTQIKHTAVTQTDTKTRVVINFNYFK